MNPQQADTLVKNIDEAVRLVLFCVRKRLGHCESFPVTFSPQQVNALDAIIQASQTSSITMEHVHNLSYSIFSQEVETFEDVARSHPMVRFLAVFARRATGEGWRHLPDLSSALARLEWCIRTSVVYDACIHAAEYTNGRNGYVLFVRND